MMVIDGLSKSTLEYWQKKLLLLVMNGVAEDRGAKSALETIASMNNCKELTRQSPFLLRTAPILIKEK